MNSMAIIAVAAALGVDVGWRQADSGGLEYIIQIEPQLVDSLLSGEAIVSDVPPALRPVRSLRVRVGRGELPREMPEGSGESMAEGSQRGVQPSDATPPTGTAVGWQPIEGGGLEYLIQIEPDALSLLGGGEELLLDLRGPPGEVSSLRITVGMETLPRIAPAVEQGTETIAADQSQPADVTQPDEEPRPRIEARAVDDSGQPNTDSPPQLVDDSSGPSLGDPAAAMSQGSNPKSIDDVTGATNATQPRTLPEPVPPGEEGGSVERFDADTDGVIATQAGILAEPMPSGGEPVPSGADAIPTLSEADQIPALSDAEATQAAAATEESPQPRQAFRPDEKPPGRFVPDKDRRPIAAQDDAGTDQGEDVQGEAAFASNEGIVAGALQQSGSGRESDGVAKPSPSAVGSDKPEKSAPASEPWWASRTVTFLGLSGSLGANVYLIWLFWGLRRRYRDLLDQLLVRSAA